MFPAQGLFIIPSQNLHCAVAAIAAITDYRSVPDVTVYLGSLGIDIEKPFETSPLEPDENGMLEYCCCQYIALGNCEPEYHHRIADIEFRVAKFHPETGIGQAHFVLEFSPIKLKYKC